MERTYVNGVESVRLEEIEENLREIYAMAIDTHDLNNALAATHGLLEVHDRRDGATNDRGVGFGNND